MAVINWLHLSDWHHGRPDSDRDTVLKALLLDIENRSGINPILYNLDFIFFTGDLAYHGKKDEFEAAGMDLLDPILLKTGVGKDRLFIIPGNHDLDQSAFKFLPPGLSKPFADHTRAQEWLREGDERDRLLDPFKAYQQFVSSYGVRGFGAFGGAENVLVNGKNIGIIGCNSALMCGRNKERGRRVNDQSHLTVGETQLRKPLDDIAKADLRIVLMHHPFDWLKEFDRRQVEQLLKGQCHFILRGHEHFAQVEVARGTQGEYIHIPGGSSYDRRKPDDPIYVNAYNFVSYNIETGMGTVYLRCLNRHGDKWIVDNETAKNGLVPFVLPIASPARSNMMTVHAIGKVSSSEELSAQTNRAEVIDLIAVRERYLRYVAKRWEYLDTRGVKQVGRADFVPLDKVYVTLTAERQVVPPMKALTISARETDKWIHNEGIESLPEYEQFVVETGESLSDRRARMLRESEKDSKQGVKIVDLPQALRESTRLVVLGDPGAGKTTLARFLARQFALACLGNRPRVLIASPTLSVSGGQNTELLSPDDYGEPRIPILLRVAEYATALGRNGNLRLSDFLHHARGEAHISDAEAAALFNEALTTGNALVLLDGLDEVAQTANRAIIVSRIDDFVSGVGAKNHILVTSRIGGYDKLKLYTNFALFTIRDMERAQIEGFIERQVIAYERAKAQDESDDEVYNRAKPEIAKIIDAVKSNEGVQRLAVNPLLLTILCQLQRTIAHLPERRIDLYAFTSKTLLEDWRPANAGIEAQIVKENQALEMLGPLAYWMHENEPTGLIAKQDAQEILCKYYAEARGLKSNHADVKTAITDFLQVVHDHTGLLIERVEGRYGFMHLTFEEYFAAREIVSDYTVAAARLRSLRHQARWEEVIRLAIAYERPKNAAHFIRSAIWNVEGKSAKNGYKPSLYEDILRRDLFLAARCLGDCVGIEPTLAREVAEELVGICLNRDIRAEHIPLLELARRMLYEVRGSELGKEAVSLLLTVLKDTNPFVRERAAWTLTLVGQGSATALDELIAALDDDEPHVRHTVAWALSRVGQGTVKAIRALLAVLQDSSRHVKTVLEGTLSTLGIVSPEALSLLLTELDDEKSNIRSAAAWALGMANQEAVEIEQRLITALQDKDETVRSAVRDVLSMGKGRPEASISLYLTALEDEDSFVRLVAASVLGRFGRHSVNVVQKLIALLKDPVSSVRAAAAAALGTTEQTSDDVIQGLLAALEDENSLVRSAAAGALGGAGKASVAVVKRLIDVLDDPDESVRSAAAQALGTAGQGSLEALSALLAALSAEDSDFCAKCGFALSMAFQGSAPEVQLLLTALENNNLARRSAAIRALGQAVQNVPEVQRKVIDALESENSGLRSTAAFALGIADQGSLDAVNGLLAAIGKQDNDVKYSAMWSLGKIGKGSEEAEIALLTALGDKDRQLRFAALNALVRLGHSTPAVMDGLLTALEHEDEDTRSEAWKALWSLVPEQ